MKLSADIKKYIKQVPIPFTTEEAALFHDENNEKIKEIKATKRTIKSMTKQESDGHHYIYLSHVTDENIIDIKKSIEENLRASDIPSASSNDSDTGSQVNSSNGDSDSPGKGPEKEDIEVQTAPVAQATKDAAAEAKAAEEAAKAAAEAKAIEEAAKAAAEAKAAEEAAKAAAEAKAAEEAAKATAEAKAAEEAAKEAQLKTVSPIRRYPNENMSSQNRWLWVKNIVSKINQAFGAKGVTAFAANDKDNRLYVCVSGATAEQIDEINRIFNEEPTPTEDLEPAEQQSNWFIIRLCMNIYGDEKFRHRITQLIFTLFMVAAALVLASFLVMHFSPAAMTVVSAIVANAIAGLTPMAFNAILGVAAGVFAVSTALLITSGFARYQYGKPENGFAGKNRLTVAENATASNKGMFAPSNANQSSILSSINPMNWKMPSFGGK